LNMPAPVYSAVPLYINIHLKNAVVTVLKGKKCAFYNKGL